MVISFSVGEARNQLLDKGSVYTFRWHRRKKIGKDWANSGRGTKKIADVFIEEVGEIEPALDLKPYLAESGFKTLWDWQWEIWEMSPNNWSKGWLYKVMIVGVKQ